MTSKQCLVRCSFIRSVLPGLLPTLVLTLSVGGGLAGCGVSDAAEHVRLVDPGAEDPMPVRSAVAVLNPVGNSGVHGIVYFSEEGSAGSAAGDGGPLEVRAEARGLSSGPHGFHVHLFGDCRGADGKSAGTHFNFAGSSLHPPKDIDRITGNLGELVANENGVATIEEKLETARLQGPYSIVGRSVIVHASGNDPESPPIGAAGARVACGVIGVTEWGTASRDGA
ncbi:MAG: superoxide dismutase family protein [Myxococcota bacterium]